MQALGSESVILEPLVVGVVALSCDINQDGHVYLLEDGLELWLTLLENAPAPTSAIMDLFRNMPPLLGQWFNCSITKMLWISFTNKILLFRYNDGTSEAVPLHSTGLRVTKPSGVFVRAWRCIGRHDKDPDQRYEIRGNSNGNETIRDMPQSGTAARSSSDKTASRQNIRVGFSIAKVATSTVQEDGIKIVYYEFQKRVQRRRTSHGHDDVSVHPGEGASWLEGYFCTGNW